MTFMLDPVNQFSHGTPGGFKLKEYGRGWALRAEAAPRATTWIPHQVRDDM
jgi:hypothetical protein